MKMLKLPKVFIIMPLISTNATTFAGALHDYTFIRDYWG